MKFRLLHGTHEDEHGKRYTAVGKHPDEGPLIETEYDLAKTFPNKFRRVNVKTAAETDVEEITEEEAKAPPKKSKRTKPPKKRVKEDDQNDSVEDDEDTDVDPEDDSDAADADGAGGEGHADSSDSDGSPDDKEDTESATSDEITLKAVHRGGGRWIVVKVIDGMQTDSPVHEGYLKKKAAKAMVAKGWTSEEE